MMQDNGRDGQDVPHIMMSDKDANGITDAGSRGPDAWSEQSQDGGVVCIRLLRVSSVFQKLQDNRSDGKGQDVPQTLASGTLKTLQWTGFYYFAKKIVTMTTARDAIAPDT